MGRSLDTTNLLGEVVEREPRRREVFARLVKSAQRHGPRRSGMRGKARDFRRAHPTALQLEAAHRTGRELREVVVFDAAEVALGFDVEGDGRGDAGSEELGEVRSPGGFVRVVLREVDCARPTVEFEQVSDVVQQRGNDEFVAAA